MKKLMAIILVVAMVVSIVPLTVGAAAKTVAITFTGIPSASITNVKLGGYTPNVGPTGGTDAVATWTNVLDTKDLPLELNVKGYKTYSGVNVPAADTTFSVNASSLTPIQYNDSLSVTVTTLDGIRVENVQGAVIRVLDASNKVLATTGTGAAGTASIAAGQITAPDAGLTQLKVEVTHPDYKAVTKNVNLYTDGSWSVASLDVEMTKTGTTTPTYKLSGTVNDKNGNPLRGATVKIETTTPITVVTNANGYWEAMVTAGAHKISVIYNGAVVYGPTDFTMGSSEQAYGTIATNATPIPGYIDPSGDTFKVDTFVAAPGGVITPSIKDIKKGSTVNIVATPDMGANIAYWLIGNDANTATRYGADFVGQVTTGVVVKNNTVTISGIDKDYYVAVAFRKSNLPVVARVAYPGGGSVSISGSNKAGETVTVKATPNKGYTFAGWDVADINGNAVGVNPFELGAEFKWKIDNPVYTQVVFTASFVRNGEGTAAGDVDGNPPPNNGSTGGSDNPKTGDESNAVLWAIMGIVALGAVAFAAKKATAK